MLLLQQHMLTLLALDQELLLLLSPIAELVLVDWLAGICISLQIQRRPEFRSALCGLLLLLLLLLLVPFLWKHCSLVLLSPRAVAVFNLNVRRRRPRSVGRQTRVCRR